MITRSLDKFRSPDQTVRWHVAVLLIWTVIGLVLRFIQLESKALWTDEFSTLVFSLGHSFRTVPLNQVISLETLLQPLVPTPESGIHEVVQHLFDESNHPPLYFVLTHLWLKQFPTVGQYVSLWGGRSLSALFGVLTIPAAFGLGWLAFRSRGVAHLSAVLMAVSPFGIYLAQEARHYTLPILWIIASLACLVAAVQHLQNSTPPPVWLCLGWVLVNALGIATHYFVTIALAVEGLVLAGLALSQWRQGKLRMGTGWGRISAVGLGTMLGGIVWLPIIQNNAESDLTQWIMRRDRAGLEWLSPIAQTLLGIVPMLYLLPIQSKQQAIVIASGLGLLILAIWTGFKLVHGLRQQWQNRPLPVAVLGGFWLGAIALFWLITYGFQRDVTSAFRYQFVYYPAAMVVMAGSLATLWQRGQRRVLICIVLLGLVGSVTVVANLGFQKTHRPDLTARRIHDETTLPAVVAIAHRTHGQTGRLMGIAWEWLRLFPQEAPPQFLLVHQEQPTEAIAPEISRALASQPRPLDLWLLNIEVSERPAVLDGLSREGCTVLDDGTEEGYRFHHLQCQEGGG